MKQPASTLRDLKAASIAILQDNDRGDFIAPGPHQYPGQWNWDAALIAIGLAHVDPDRARHEVSQLLRGQWDDGLLPHVVFWNAEADYFPGPGVWRSSDVPGSPAIPVTGITQPPILASAVRLLHERHPDPAFLHAVVPSIERWHAWLHGTRRVGESLITIVHPWESGTDNSPRFDEALDTVDVERETILARRDTRHVPARQRPTTSQYERYLSIVETLRTAAYRPDLAISPFAYGDVGFTSILVRAEEDLIELEREIGDSGATARQRLESARSAISGAWDPAAEAFLDREPATGAAMSTSADCVSALLPLYAGSTTPAQASTLAREANAPDRFGPSLEHPWAVTSVAKSHESFDRLRYWRGPVWVNLNWLLIRGLQRAGCGEQASELRHQTLELVARNGMHEYYDPVTGEGLGSDRFSWTAALTLDLVETG